MIRSWVKLSFIYLLIVGILGCLLRLVFFMPVEGVNFRYFLHAHSHVAFLGWIFNALFAAMIYGWIPEKAVSYKWLFWLLQVAVLGMMLSFPIQGYAAVSITFSTLHILLSYWFAGKFLRDTAGFKNYGISLLFIRWALFFMILSSLGPFALGAIMAQGLAGSDLYQLAIYFYLHFQYDGWFSFAVFGLFFLLLEKNNIPFSMRHVRLFLWLMAAAAIPAYALSALWTKPQPWVYIVAFAAAALQVLALVPLIRLTKNAAKQLSQEVNHQALALMKFALWAFILKILLQQMSAFPAIADLAYNVRNFTIGYLHIVFIGFVSVFLIAWFQQTGLVNHSGKRTTLGIRLFLVGFLLSEALIFAQPVLPLTGFGILPWSFQLLFWVSLFMPVGTALFLAGEREPGK